MLSELDLVLRNGLRGHALRGLNLVVSGNVPQGAGLSSSASLEVAIGQAFKEALGLHISQAEIARRLGRDRSTICRELRRNPLPGRY